MWRELQAAAGHTQTTSVAMLTGTRQDGKLQPN